MEQFDREALHRLEAEAPHTRILAIKVHGGPTDFFHELAEEGRLIGQANFRDPRDTVPALLDAGEAANRKGYGSFSDMDSWQAAIELYEKNLFRFEQWAGVPGIITTHYDEVAFNSEKFLARVAAQLGTQDIEGLDLPAIADNVKRNRFTQFNKGIPRRHRDEITINQALFLTQRFGRQMETYLGGTLDPLDRAFIAAANELPAPDMDFPKPAAPGVFEKARRGMNTWLYKAVCELRRYRRTMERKFK
jgi:hypothetical protein